MLAVENTVDDRIAHVHIGACHIDLRPQNLAAFFEIARDHLIEQLLIFFDASVSVRAFGTGLRESPSALPDFFEALIVNVREAL